jgi:hypothetical protein
LNEKAVSQVKASYENYTRELKKLGGVYFLLKLKDSKPSEHVSKIKLYDFIIYLAFAVLTAMAYQARRPDAQSFWTRKGVEEAFMVRSNPTYYNQNYTVFPPPNEYWTQVPRFTDLRRRSDVLWWLNTTLPSVIWGTEQDNTSHLAKYNMLPGYVSIRVQSTRKAFGNDARWKFCELTNDEVVQTTTNVECQKPFLTQWNQDTRRIYSLESYWKNQLEVHKTRIDIRGPSKPYIWKSHEEREKEERIHWLAGKISWYDGSGYMVQYRMNIERPKEQLFKYRDDMEQLQSVNWFSTRSRVVIVSLTTYNFEYDLWTACDFLFEMPPGGAIKTAHTIRVFKPAVNENAAELSGTLQDMLRAILCLYVLVFVGIAERRHKTKNHKAGFFYHISLNGIADLGIVVCTFVAIGYRLVIFFQSTSAKYMEEVQDEAGTGSISSSQLAYTVNSIFMVEGILFVFLMYRLLSLFRISRTIYSLWHTIGIALKALVFLIGLFLPTIIGFALLTYALFGALLPEFENLETTGLIVYRLLRGDAPFLELMQLMPVWTVVVTTLFYCVMKFCLLSIFAFVVLDAYYIVQVTSPITASDYWGFRRWFQWAVPPVCLNMLSAMFTSDSNEGS